MTRPDDTLVICAATQYWDEAWFRKQHFMHKLSLKRDVLYVEPSYSLARRRPSHCPPGQDNPILLPRLRQREARLWTLTPPRGFPFWTHSRVSPWQYRYYGSLLRRAAARLNRTRVWLWLYNPLFMQSVPTLKPDRIILDLVDDLGAYEARSHSRRTMGRSLEEALTRADLVYCTSRSLAEEYASRTRPGKMHVISNGVRGDWIDRLEVAPPPDVAALPHPRIGFVGALFSYLDFDLLTAVARANPTGSLVLVGPVLDQAGVSCLTTQPNVFLLGPRPQEKIPEYLSAFDVCVCPFRPGAVRKAVNPLKVYEYLAAGRPVVSTPLESLTNEPVARWIHFAEGASPFVAAVQRALAEETPALGRARREAMRPYSWEALAVEVETILDHTEEGWLAPLDADPATGDGA